MARSDGLLVPWVVESQLGNLKQAEIHYQRVLADAERVGDGWEIYGFGHLTSESARLMSSRRYFDLVQKSGRRLVASPSATVWQKTFARLALGMVAAEEQDAAQAAEAYEYLVKLNRAERGWSYRQLGVVAHAAGFEDRAVEHFENALAFTRKGGYLPLLAWTCCDYGDLLRQRKSAGGSQKATALFDEGLAIARDLGMRPLMERILARRQFLKARRVVGRRRRTTRYVDRPVCGAAVGF